jgi:hypothetical protein
LCPTDLRHIIWALQDRYSGCDGHGDSASRAQNEIPKIRQWLLDNGNSPSSEVTFDGFLSALSELAELGFTKEEPSEKIEELAKRAEIAFSQDVAPLQARWESLTVARFLSHWDSEPIINAIKTLLARCATLNLSSITNMDDVERFRSLPECGRNVLKWLSGEMAKPRTFYVNLDLISSRSGLAAALRRRLAEFATCVEELEDCLACPALGEVSIVHDHLTQLLELVRREQQGMQPFSEEIRRLGAKRGNSLLDGACEGDFTLTGKIRPRLIFKHAADIELTKHEKSSMILDRARLTVATASDAQKKKKTPKKPKGTSGAGS